jgi:hypothetical protein
MADFDAKNYSLINSVPAKQAEIGEVCGKMKILFDEFDCAQNVYAISDKILIGAKLPKGARVLEAQLVSPSLGTTGIMQLGFLANGVDAQDLDAFIVSADAGGQAVKALIPAGAAGLHKKFEAETQLVINFTEASDAATGDKISVAIHYVMD